jgi:hypothetical protein
MTYRELLELAAKAAGYTTIQYQNLKDSSLNIRYGIDEAIWNGEDYWNPLENDGTALRLAVKLGLRIEINTQVLGDTLVISEFYDNVECHNGDPYAATRKAIVRAAAEIGKGMEVTK